MDKRQELLLAKAHNLYHKASELGAGEEALNLLSRYSMTDGLVEETPNVEPEEINPADIHKMLQPVELDNPLSAPVYQVGGYGAQLMSQSQRMAQVEKLYDKFADYAGNLSAWEMSKGLDRFRHVDVFALFEDEQEDPEFDIKSDEVKDLISALPEEYQERFYLERPVNMSQATRIAKTLSDEYELLSEYGSAGFWPLMQAEILSMLRDKVFLGTTAATLGAGLTLNAAVKGLQMTRTAMKTARAMEFIGLPLVEAGAYSAMLAKSLDTYNSHDAAMDTVIAAALIGPLGYYGYRTAGRLDAAKLARNDLADASLAELAKASKQVLEAETQSAARRLIAERSYSELLDDVKANLTAQAGQKMARGERKALAAEYRMLTEQIENLSNQKDALISNNKGRLTGKTEEVASLNARIESLEDMRDRVRFLQERDEAARTAESELSRVEEWIRRERLIEEAQDAKAVLESRLQKLQEDSAKSKGAAKKTAKVMDDLKAQISKLDAEVVRLQKMQAPESVRGVEAEMQRRLSEQAEVRPESPEIETEVLTPGQESAVRTLEETEKDRKQISAYLRHDFWGKTQKSASQSMRNWGHKLMSNGIRRMDDVQLNAADVVAQRRTENHIAPKNRELAKEFRAYLKELGINRFNLLTRWKVHKALSQVSNDLSVYRITGNTPDNPHLQRMLEIIEERMAGATDDFIKSGAEGSGSLKHSKNYLPRIWVKDKMFAIKMKYGEVEGQKLIVQAIRNGLMNKDPEMPKAAAEMIARGVAEAASNGRVVMDDIFTDEIKFMEFMDEILEAEALRTGKTVDQLVHETFDYLAKHKDENKGKNRMDVINRLKPRLDIDIFAKSDNGEVSVQDMLNMNIFQVSEMYVRQMEGAAALAEKGLKSPKAIRELRETIERELKSQNVDDVKIRKELELFDDVITMVHGSPVHFKNLTNKQKEIAGNMLQVTSLQMLGMAGPAGMAELVGSIARGGVLTALKAIPALRGKGAVKLAKEFEKFGFNVDNLYYNHYFNLYEETGMYGQASWFSRHLHDASKGFAIASLMAPFDKWSRQLSFFMSIDKSAKLAREKGKLLFNRAELGMSEAQYAKAVEYMKNHTETTRGVFGDTVDTVNFERWDRDTREAFLTGLYRMNAHQVLKLLAGERVQLFGGTIDSFLFQFQQLLLSGIYKSLGNKIVNWNRTETWLTLMGEIVGGTLWYTARNEIKAAGMSDREKDKWRDKQFGDAFNYGFGALGYTTTFGGLFSFYNKFAAPFGFTTFGQRYSSIEGALFSSPWLSTMENLTRATGSALMGDFDERDLQRLWRTIPMNSWYGAHFINNSLLRD